MFARLLLGTQMGSHEDGAILPDTRMHAVAATAAVHPFLCGRWLVGGFVAVCRSALQCVALPCSVLVRIYAPGAATGLTESARYWLWAQLVLKTVPWSRLHSHMQRWVNVGIWLELLEQH